MHMHQPDSPDNTKTALKMLKIRGKLRRWVTC